MAQKPIFILWPQWINSNFLRLLSCFKSAPPFPEKQESSSYSEEVENMIDPGIADLVATMNRSDLIKTIGSCQGHPIKKLPPYVYFSSSVETATRIEKALRAWERGANRRLHTNWLLSGQFNEKCELCFCLHAPEYHHYTNSLAGSLFLFSIKKHLVRQDLTALTELIRQTILDKGQDNKDDHGG